VKLGIVYHMPFWQAADGSWWELEGSFARYVDSLAPYFDEISLCVPVYATAQPAGTRLRAANVTVAPLPFFDGPKHFYPKLPSMLARIARWVRQIDLLHCRVHSSSRDCSARRCFCSWSATSRRCCRPCRIAA
jgi:hypothetical protein